MKSPTLRAALGTLVFGVLVAAAPLAQAVSIDLENTIKGSPDLTLFNGALNYTYVKVCASSEGNGAPTGICGTSHGNTTWNGDQDWGLTYGKLVVDYQTDGSAMSLQPTGGSAPLPVTGTYVPGSGATTSSSANYSLSVILGFDGAGFAVSVLGVDPWLGDAPFSSVLAAKGKTGTVGYDSGTLVTGTPTSALASPFNKPFQFGYGGSGTGGIFEFVYNDIGGDYSPFASSKGGIIINTGNTLCRGVWTYATTTCSGTTLGTDWDDQGSSFWTSNFSGAVTASTFVSPAPATVWLLGTGLTVLGGRRWLRRKISS